MVLFFFNSHWHLNRKLVSALSAKGVWLKNHIFSNLDVELGASMQALGFGTTKGNQVLGETASLRWLVVHLYFPPFGNTSVPFLFEWLVLVGLKSTIQLLVVGFKTTSHPYAGRERERTALWWLVVHLYFSPFGNISVVFYVCPLIAFNTKYQVAQCKTLLIFYSLKIILSAYHLRSFLVTQGTSFMNKDISGRGYAPLYHKYCIHLLLLYILNGYKCLQVFPKSFYAI